MWTMVALLLAAAQASPQAGALPDALPLDAGTLSRLPAASATLTAHGRTSQCGGVWLADLAAAADGYSAAFTLAELDAKLGNRRVLVATHCDNTPLDATTGPLRLVVPGEIRAARSVRQLQRLKIRVIQ
jgi:hypothetical protein